MDYSNDIQIEKEWTAILQIFENLGGISIVVGGVDVGKSTFIRWLANELLVKGVRPAIVDCDVGQSDIGPPTTIGMALIQRHFACYEDISADEIYFVGSVQPSGHLLQGLTGTFRLANKALAKGATHVIVNTTGWIEGAAIIYKQCKIDALRPSVIVAFQREKELNAIVSAYKRMNSTSLHFLSPSPQVQVRERELRRARRAQNFDRYFRDSVLIALSVGRVGISGIEFPLTVERVKGQLIALIDDYDNHKALGIVETFNYKNRQLEIRTPFKGNISRIRRLHFENFLFTEGKGDDYSGEN